MPDAGDAVAVDSSGLKLALLADLHANLEALTACLAHARTEGADRYAFLGDLVGYGADPLEVLDLVASHAAAGAILVRGNHDAAALGQGAERMNATAEEAIRWTQRRLTPRHRAFLADLPPVVREDDRLFVHASAFAPESWIYVTDPERARQSLDAAGGATLVFSGHVHEPSLFYTSAAQRPVPFTPMPGVPIPIPAHRRWLVIPGSVGQPRDGNTAACWAMADLARATITYHRVPYDWAVAARKIRDAGLPERLARRLERGA
jgi:diadenosine tetraphosphatase ApaH/serine/threonine PP2A family protein phosphatase